MMYRLKAGIRWSAISLGIGIGLVVYLAIVAFLPIWLAVCTVRFLHVTDVNMAMPIWLAWFIPTNFTLAGLTFGIGWGK